MTTKNDGGLAFGGTRFEPTAIGAARSHNEVTYPGMSMRDYFAGQALAGLLANANLMDHLDAGDNPLAETAFAASIARGCMVYSDAMLEARK